MGLTCLDTENGVNAEIYYTRQKKVFSATVEQQKLRLEVEGEEGCFVELSTPWQIQRTTGDFVVSIQIGHCSAGAPLRDQGVGPSGVSFGTW